MYREATYRKINVASWDEQLALFLHAVDTYKHVDVVIPLATSQSHEDWFADDQNSGDAPPKPDLEPVNIQHIGLIYCTSFGPCQVLTP
jgi:hypothetical protein